MAIINRIEDLGRRAFGAAKRPLWQAVHALTGRRPQAAVRYFDFGMYGGHFDADAKSLSDRLPPGFQVVEHRAGLVEVEIWCAEYRRMDFLQPYNELGVIVPVRFVQKGQSPLPGGYVLHMPVTTEEARWGGVDIYGFPKIVADIVIKDEDGQKICTAHHRGVHVLTLRVAGGPVETFTASARMINVRDDGHVIACVFEMTGDQGVHPERGGVSLELGLHAIADELRRIGLGADTGRRLYVPSARGVLGKGTDLGALPARGPAERPRVSGTSNGPSAALGSPNGRRSFQPSR